jgi:hypothetical protein
LNPIFRANIKKGKVVFDNVESFNNYLIPFEGKEVDVVVKKRKKSRTNPQNAYYWACIVAIPAEHFGYTQDEMHEAMKFMFLKKQEEGKPLTVRSTTSLSTIEFSEYVEKCRQFCAEEGLYIPDPDEIEYTGKDQEVIDEENKPVAIDFLDFIFSRAESGKITEERIIEISKENFGKEPRDLTQIEAESLDSLIVSELPE